MSDEQALLKLLERKKLAMDQEDLERGAMEAGKAAETTSIFPQMTEEQKVAHPYMEATAQTGRDVVTIPANFFNQLLMNAPRSIAESAGVEYPSETENVPAQVIGKTAGVVGAFKSPVARAIGGIASGGGGIAQQMGKGAIAGALGGAAYSPEEFTDVGARTGQALVGGVLGGATAGILGAGGRGIGLAKKGLASLRKPSTATRIGKAGRKIAQTKQANITKATQQINDDVGKLKVDLQKAAEKGSTDYQKKLPAFFRRNSDEYGKRLDDIATDLIEQNKGVTNDEMRDILTRTLQEADEERLMTGRGREIMQDLLDSKYAAGAKTRGGAGRLSAKVDFRDIVKDYQKINKTVSSTAKRGTQGFAEEDIIISMFRKNFGDTVSDIVPEYKGLNKAYAPVIKGMKKAHQTFKPFKGEYDTKTATGLLKRAAGEGTPLERGERKLIETVERGTEFGKGVGKVSAGARKAGEKITARKTAGVAQKEAIRGKATERLGKVQKLKEKAEVSAKKAKILLAALGISGGVGLLGAGARLVKGSMRNIQKGGGSSGTSGF